MMLNMMEEAPLAPPWRSFQLFNGYRLVLALLLGLMPFLPWQESLKLDVLERQFLLVVGSGYGGLVALGLLLSLLWRVRFHAQLTTQVLVDMVGINLLMFVLGGLRSGLGVVLLVSVAGASLVARAA